MTTNQIANEILPYSRIVGQQRLKLALELAYVAPAIGGVLISGQRGTGKSTTVRAFARMMYGRLPVTLPISATEDRVIGDWDIDELMRNQEAVFKPGLLETADGTILYVDEVNLLDDHIVNILLDTAASGVLEVQRQGIDRDPTPTKFTLVGTMNPDEGRLRAQLLDRFGLVAQVVTENDKRAEILRTVLEYERARMIRESQRTESEFFTSAWKEDALKKDTLESARARIHGAQLNDLIQEGCVRLSNTFSVVGHRCEHIMAHAAQALAALEGDGEVTIEHLRAVAPLALVHRRSEVPVEWKDEDDSLIVETLRPLAEPGAVL